MTFEKVREIIVETINCDEEQVVLTAKLKEDIGIDSLDAMELSMALEEAYETTIDEETLQGFITVQDIVSFIDAKCV